MNHPYIDLHTHTCLPDGNLTPEELLIAAGGAGRIKESSGPLCVFRRGPPTFKPNAGDGTEAVPYK